MLKGRDRPGRDKRFPSWSQILVFIILITLLWLSPVCLFAAPRLLYVPAILQKDEMTWRLVRGNGKSEHYQFLSSDTHPLLGTWKTASVLLCGSEAQIASEITLKNLLAAFSLYSY